MNIKFQEIAGVYLYTGVFCLGILGREDDDCLHGLYLWVDRDLVMTLGLLLADECGLDGFYLWDVKIV